MPAANLLRTRNRHHGRFCTRRILEDRVTVPLRDILLTLADAVQGRRGWLHDFEDDEVTISSDLYEVLLAYQHYRRPSA